MIIRGRSGTGDEENEDNIREKKAVEMEVRRVAMIKRCENKQSLRRLHTERKAAHEFEKSQRSKEAADLNLRRTQHTQRLAEELSRRKNIELQDSLKSRKIKSFIHVPPRCILKEEKSELIEPEVKQEDVNSFGGWHRDDDKKQRKEAEEKKQNYRRDLQNQLIHNLCRRREREEEKHRERKILEEAGEILHKEDTDVERQKKETTTLLQAEKLAFFRARQIWKEKRMNTLRKEHEEIGRIIAEKETKLRETAEEKTNVEAIKESLTEKLGKKLMDEEFRRKEREDICRELYLAQRDKELAREAIHSATRKKRASYELLQDMAKQQKAVAERKAKEDAIDAAFARYLAEERRNFAAKEERKEQEKRDKNIQYGDELRQTIMKKLAGNEIKSK